MDKLRPISRWPLLLLLCFVVAMGSCDREDPVAQIGGVPLDELNDKEERVGSLEVNCTTYLGREVDRLVVNGTEQPIDRSLQLTDAGYYRLEVFLQGAGTGVPEIIRIVLLDPKRGEAEWGLRKWTPAPPPQGHLGTREPILIHPRKVPTGVRIPFILRLEPGDEPQLQTLDARVGSVTFTLKGDIGSTQIPSGEVEGATLSIDKRIFPLEMETDTTEPVIVEGNLSGDLHIGADTYVRVSGDLTIPAGVSLSIDSGAFIAVDKAVNIYCEGALLIHGTAGRPVTFTCSEAGSHWGGFIGRGSGNRMEASHTIFSYSGFHTGGDFSYGHANRQALVYNENGVLRFDHCYFIDQAGQVFYPVSSTLELTYCLVQRAMTSGQLNSSEVAIDHTVFTDFPDDSYEYRDEDNDALYLMECNATITHCLFMFAKDDGLDSGGSGGGTVTVLHSRFEVIFHEGAALSSAGGVTKNHFFKDCTFNNCGQGLELGYSSSNHLVTVDSCQFTKNGIGIRYGDNYGEPVRGTLRVSNSISIQNESYDVWNMIRDTWSADTLKMEFDHVFVSTPNPMYPELKLYE
jgi:hypothetical protein